MSGKINLVFMGVFTYPRGMAATKRIQNAINSLKNINGIETRVILQRQSSELNNLSGVYDGTPYETIMGDLLRAKMILTLPFLCIKTNAALKKAFKPSSKNVIYFYGPLFIENILPLKYAKRLGYKIVFDVIEDYGLAKEVSHSFYYDMRGRIANRFSSLMKAMSDGGIVISSHIEEKFRALTQGKVPIHYLPISVNMDRFPVIPRRTKSTISMFYAGSFGKKDGLLVLLDAFDWLAAKYEGIRLVLTGKGDAEAMQEFYARMDVSNFRYRIEYKGYLDDDGYYSTLNDADIPCMTRVDLAFAHAGFPFKLGEFLATGKPVVVSRVSDVERFLVDRHSAMVVTPGSSEEVCKAVEFLIDNPESAAAIGRRGRNVAETFFDYQRQGKALLAFLENV